LPERLRRLLGHGWLKAAFNSAAGFALLAFALRSLPLSQVRDHLRPKHPEALLLLVGLVVLAQLARAARWRWLLGPLARVPVLDALWINAAGGFLNYVVPVRAGEAARVVWLNRRHRLAPGAAAGCLVVDHSFDLCGVIIVLSTGAVLSATALARMPAMPTLLLALAGALAMLAAIVGAAVLGPGAAASTRIPRRLGSRLAGHAASFRSGAVAACEPRRLALLAAASALAVLCDGLAFAMLFHSLGLAVPVASAVVAQVALLYAYVLPAAPGYVGSLEATGTLVLSGGLGLQAGAAAGAIVVWHVAGAAVILGLGAVALWKLRGQFGAPEPAIG
jgi:glycosyltransferase 2 family protein